MLARGNENFRALGESRTRDLPNPIISPGKQTGTSWREFLFTNPRSIGKLLRILDMFLKFKSQLTIAFFAAVNHLNGPLRKQDLTLMGSKGQVL